MNAYKMKLIDALILPALDKITVSERLVSSLYESCTLHQAVKFQLLELPGPFDEGRLWFSVESMVQAYYFCSYRQSKWGTRIWKRREFILNYSSLLNKEFRPDYIEVLEPGELLSITYTGLLNLIAEFPELEKQVQGIAANNEHYYRNRTQLLNRPPLERVQEFEKDNALFVNIAGKEAIAMHVGLTRQGYHSQLRKRTTSPLN